MAEIEYKIDKASIERAERRMRQLQKQIPDLTIPHKKISIFLDQWVLRNFQTEGRNVGGWANFKAGGRRRKGGGIDTTAKLLQDTGVLRRSFVPFSSKKSAGIGSDLFYSKPHQEGERSRNLPQRRMIPNKTKDRKIIVDVAKIYESHLSKSLRDPT
jgi:phage gpG-like protein